MTRLTLMSFWWHWRALDCWKILCLIYFGFLTQILWIFRRKKKQTNFHFRFKFKQKCWLLVFGHIRGLNKTSVEHNVNNNSIFHKIKIISMRKNHQSFRPPIALLYLAQQRFPFCSTSQQKVLTIPHEIIPSLHLLPNPPQPTEPFQPFSILRDTNYSSVT